MLWDGLVLRCFPPTQISGNIERSGTMGGRTLSGAPTPGGASLDRSGRRMVLMMVVPLFSKSTWPLCTGSDFGFLIGSFVIPPRRLANGGATAMSTDSNL